MVVFLIAWVVTRPALYSMPQARLGIYAALTFVWPLASVCGWGVAVPKPVGYIIPFMMGSLLCMLDHYPDVLQPLGLVEGESGSTPFLASKLLLQPEPASLTRPLHILREWLQSRPRVFTSIQFGLWSVVLYCGSFPVDVMLGHLPGTEIPKGRVWMPLRSVFGWWWISLAAGCVMVSALTWPAFQCLLRSSPVAFCGRVSFGVYLFHLQVCSTLSTPFTPQNSCSLRTPIADLLRGRYLDRAPCRRRRLVSRRRGPAAARRAHNSPLSSRSDSLHANCRQFCYSVGARRRGNGFPCRP